MLEKCKNCIVKGCQFDPVYDGMKFRSDCGIVFRKHKKERKDGKR